MQTNIICNAGNRTKPLNLNRCKIVYGYIFGLEFDLDKRTMHPKFNQPALNP